MIKLTMNYLHSWYCVNRAVQNGDQCTHEAIRPSMTKTQHRPAPITTTAAADQDRAAATTIITVAATPEHHHQPRGQYEATRRTVTGTVTRIVEAKGIITEAEIMTGTMTGIGIAAVAVIAIVIVIMIGTMDVVATTIIVHMRAVVVTTMTAEIVRGSVNGRKPGSVIGSVRENGIGIVDTRALHHPHQQRPQVDQDQHHHLHRR